MHWQHLSACQGLGNDLFYGLPDGGTAASAARHNPDASRADSRRIQNAKRVCRSCLVRKDCLAHAMDYPEQWGIWGGLTAAQRAKARSRETEQ